MKSQYLELAVDKPTLEIMKAIKKVFDPKGILNPGKMFVYRSAGSLPAMSANARK